MNKEDKRYNIEIVRFGNKLKELREGRDLTQLDLELSSGIDRSEISRIENGMRNIEFLTIVKLSIALKISISDFFVDNPPLSSED